MIFFEKIGDPTLGKTSFTLFAIHLQGNGWYRWNRKWMAYNQYFSACGRQDVILRQGAPKSKVRFLGPKTTPLGVKTLTYIALTYFLSLRISVRIFLLYITFA